MMAENRRHAFTSVGNKNKVSEQIMPEIWRGLGGK
jgi:hypothetical protein